MLTVALDEAGVFDEGQIIHKFDCKTTFIGGFIYDDCGDITDKENERNRIGSFYKSVIQDIRDIGNLKTENGELPQYPRDLHPFKAAKNIDVSRNVRHTINNHLSEFLEKGTYKENDLIDAKRKGKYWVVAIVKSATGKEFLLDRNVGEFFRDGIASNLYFHMASEAFERLVFNNPYYGKPCEFALDIATRKAYVSEEFVKSYQDQGIWIKEDPNSDDKYYISLMNADVCRTILFEKLVMIPDNSISIKDFRVESIQYEKKGKNDQNNPFIPDEYVFQYLSDSICSFLSVGLKKNDINGVVSNSKKLVREENTIVFSYDKTDVFFDRAWKEHEKGDYYGTLKEMYRLKTLNTEEGKYYTKKWVPYLERSIIEETKKTYGKYQVSQNVRRAVEALRDSCLTNTLDAEEGNYIFKVLKKATESVTDGKMLYYINDLGVVMNCHQGASKKAIQYFKNCEKYAEYAAIEDYTRTRNRFATSLLDGFDYEGAEKVIEETISLLTDLVGLNQKHFGRTELAKTLSLKGQYLAFLRKPEALEFFDRALKLYKEDIANYKITQSYKLHYLIDSGNRAGFINEMESYSGGAFSLKDQLKRISQMGKTGDININYALFIMLKALFRLYDDTDIQSVWDDIKVICKYIPNAKKQGHPWELNYKYLFLLAYRMGDKGLFDDYYKKMMRITESKDQDTTIHAIGLYGELELLEEKGVTDLDAKYNKLYEYVVSDFPHYIRGFKPVHDIQGRILSLRSKFTYTFC